MSKQAAQFLTSSDDPNAYPAQDMVSLLHLNANKFKGRDLYYFLEDGLNIHTRITHDEAFEMAKSLAAQLQAHGNKGDRVMLLFPTGINFTVALFACFLSGMIAVPTYPPHRKKANPRFTSILEDADPLILLSTDKIIEDLKIADQNGNLVKNRIILSFEKIAQQTEHAWKDPGIEPEDIALLQYTSGSTGTPMGVMVSHSNIIHNSECIKQSFGFDENLRGMNWLPNFHDMGLIGCLIQPAYVGGMNIIMPPMKFLQQPANWLKGISNFKATNAGGPNFTYEYCINKAIEDDLKDLDLGSLSTMFCGAEPIRAETLDDFTDKFSEARFNHSQFYPCYGLAESVLIATGGDFTKEPIYLDVDTKELENNRVKPTESNEDKRRLTACGFPWLGMNVMIVNPETKVPCDKGEIGEIWLKGPSITQGYWKKPDETEQTYNAYAEGVEEGPWMRSGDLGFIHDGQLYVSGRLKDLIIIRGSNFFPNDIEYSVENCHEALRKNAGAAFSMDIDEREKLIIIQEIERNYMRDFDKEEVFESIRNAVFEDHGIQPDIIVLARMGSIKKTSSGKTQRFAMRSAWKNEEFEVLASWEKKEEKQADTPDISFRPEFLREWMINWMAQQLDLHPDNIDPDKPVSVYGLDSLKAVALERDVNKQFGVEWPLESFLKENTINELVEEGIELLRSKS